MTGSLAATVMNPKSSSSIISPLLGRVDLKLLLALQVLLEEQHVTRAAQRLCISQPAMSKTLLRLKEVFNDPLFTRGPHGLSPTPKARNLARALPALIHAFQRFIEGEDFQADRFEGQFHIALPQWVAEMTLPALINRLAQEAPGVRLISSEIPANYLEQMASGQLDFVIQREQGVTADFLTETLGTGNAHCLMRHDHPLAEKSGMTLDDYLRYPHIRVSFPGMTDDNTGIIDQVLHRQGLERHIVLETPQLTAALETLINSDCLMVGSSHLTLVSSYQSSLRAMAFPPPLVFPPLAFSLLHHQRTVSSLPHQWFKDVLANITRQFLQSRAN